jgi:hypothetical protein
VFGVETASEVLVALAQRYAFGEVAALVGMGAGGERSSASQIRPVPRRFVQHLAEQDH